MKKLSIEEKATRYDEAIERARKCLDEKRDTCFVRPDVIFPELAESEDERIRKELLNAFQESEDSLYMVLTPHRRESFIAWLKKHGEQKPAEYTLEQAAGIFLDALSNTPYNNKPIVDAQVITKELLKFLADTSSYNPNAINEQKPKFEIDDLITNGKLVGKIEAIHKLGYHAYFGDYYADVLDAENWHKWTIEDAKDGDVLVFDAGYTFDFKKKELKNWLKSLRPQKHWKPTGAQLASLEIACDRNDRIGFELTELLKGLKKYGGCSMLPQWKPSDKQIDALDYYANSLCTYCDRQDDLRSLFNDLKRLREE